MRCLLLLLLVLHASVTVAQEAPRPLDELWREATLWEVGSNAEKVPAARKALIARGDEALDFLIPAKLDTKDTLVTRALSVVVTGVKGRAAEKLRAALAHEAPNVRRNAADLLGQLGDSESAPAIAALLDHPETRGGALAALGALKDRASVPAIAAIMERAGGDVKERERVTSAATLGGIGGPHAEAALVRALGSDRAQVRFAAQLALERLGQAAPLAPVAVSGEGPARLHAIQALGRIGDVSAATMLLSLLSDRAPPVRGFAAEALGRLKSGADIAALRAALGRESDPFVRGKLSEAIDAISAR